jgi:RNA polymerase sigma-70 factor (ECF subfamily)
VRIYQDMVFACCRTVGLREDEIEDAASESFLAAYKSIKKYSGKSKLSSWLWKIAYHKALDYRRKEPNKPVPDADMSETIPAASAAPEINLADQAKSPPSEAVQ